MKADTEGLDELERQLASERTELQALEERTRVLEVEVEAWRGPPSRRLQWLQNRRDTGLAFLGFCLGTVAIVCPAILIASLVYR